MTLSGFDMVGHQGIPVSDIELSFADHRMCPVITGAPGDLEAADDPEILRSCIHQSHLPLSFRITVQQSAGRNDRTSSQVFS